MKNMFILGNGFDIDLGLNSKICFMRKKVQIIHLRNFSLLPFFSQNNSM